MSDLILKFVKWLDAQTEGKISEHYEEQSSNAQTSHRSSMFEDFVLALNNPYAEDRVGTDKYNKFHLQLVQKFATYLSLDNIFMTMAGAQKNYPYRVIEAIFRTTEDQVQLNAKSTFIAYPWSGGNLTGNTNAYHGVVAHGFEHDPRNHKGFYFQDLDIAFVFNGNHSISIGTLMDDVKVVTSSIFPAGILNKEFFDAKISFNALKMGNETYPIEDWKFAALLYSIQKVYKS